MAEMNRRLREHLAAWFEAEVAQQIRWQPPQPGFFKVNFNAAIRGRAILELNFVYEGQLVGHIKRSIRELLKAHPCWRLKWAPEKTNGLSHFRLGCLLFSLRFL